MSDYTVKVNLPDHKRGDRWNGISSIGPVIVNSGTPSNPLTRIRMHFNHSLGETFRLDSDTGVSPDAVINIDDSIQWQASIPEVNKFLSTNGDWEWDMEFYESGKSGPLTFYKGVLHVCDDVTK